MVNTDGAPPPGPTCVVDPTTGRPILMAPMRQQRPFYTGAHAVAASCPFCPGHEASTPPAIDSARRTPGTHDDSGWIVRAFPNKYPANAHHIVIAEGDLHREQAGDLDVAIWQDVVTLWQRRVRALEQEPGIGCTFLFKNVGVAAGASIAHSHSQLLGLPEPPPRLLLEQRQAAALPYCPWCATIATARRDGREIAAAADHIALAPEPPKLPYETWILPRRCDDDFLTTSAESLAGVLHAVFVAVAAALHRPAWNLWLHRLPGARFHWHFELQPRTGQLAGLEIGGDMYINSLPAVDAARRLRTALAGGAPLARDP